MPLNFIEDPGPAAYKTPKLSISRSAGFRFNAAAVYQIDALEDGTNVAFATGRNGDLFLVICENGKGRKLRREDGAAGLQFTARGLRRQLVGTYEGVYRYRIRPEATNRDGYQCHRLVPEEDVTED